MRRSISRWTAPWRRNSPPRGRTASPPTGIYVQRGLYEAFVEKFGAATAALQVGHGLDPETDIGPMTVLAGAAEVPGSDRGCARPRGSAGRRAAAAPMRPRKLRPPDRPGRCHRSHADRPRGDLRAGRGHLALRHRGGGRPARQRHRDGPRGLSLLQRPAAHPAGFRGAGIRHGRASTPLPSRGRRSPSGAGSNPGSAAKAHATASPTIWS